jgi:hypothetical protein
LTKITDEQIARVLRDSLDLDWGGELYESGKGGAYHQGENFAAKIEDGTLVIGSDNDDFYAVPLNIKALREQFAKVGIEL